TAWKGGFYRQQSSSGPQTKYTQTGPGDAFSAESIFSDLFGARMRPRGGKRKGEDVTYSISVSFLEAAQGAKKRVRLADGKTIDVRIPPATDDGQSLRLKGQGRPGAGGGPAGDALIEINVQPDDHFSRQGKNVYLEVPVTLQEALLGAVITVPTIHGKVSMKIPAGSNTGTTLRLKEKGLPGKGSDKAGDQYVKLKLVLPDKPDQELSDFVKNWSQTHGYDPRRAAGLNGSGEQ
ncbi:MAG: J domain-containing protein, partial [Pseudomonadota bacterium]